MMASFETLNLVFMIMIYGDCKTSMLSPVFDIFFLLLLISIILAALLLSSERFNT